FHRLYYSLFDAGLNHSNPIFLLGVFNTYINKVYFFRILILTSCEKEEDMINLNKETPEEEIINEIDVNMEPVSGNVTGKYFSLFCLYFYWIEKASIPSLQKNSLYYKFSQA
ncbi:hypothetical protein ACJX0J_035912, partial [Zea mays]